MWYNIHYCPLPVFGTCCKMVIAVAGTVTCFATVIRLMQSGHLPIVTYIATVGCIFTSSSLEAALRNLPQGEWSCCFFLEFLQGDGEVIMTWICCGFRVLQRGVKNCWGGLVAVIYCHMFTCTGHFLFGYWENEGVLSRGVLQRIQIKKLKEYKPWRQRLTTPKKKKKNEISPKK